MDILTTPLIILTVTMLWTTWLAYRQGNEKRDIRMLAALSGAFGFGSLFAAFG
jgi:hypothetical protein